MVRNDRPRACGLSAASETTPVDAVPRLGWRFHPPVDPAGPSGPQSTLGPRSRPRPRAWVRTVVAGGLLVAGCFLLAGTADHRGWMLIAGTFTTTGWLLAIAAAVLAWWQYVAAGRRARRTSTGFSITTCRTVGHRVPAAAVPLSRVRARGNPTASTPGNTASTSSAATCADGKPSSP